MAATKAQLAAAACAADEAAAGDDSTTEEIETQSAEEENNSPYLDDKHDKIISGGVYHLKGPGGSLVTVNARGKRINPDGTLFGTRAMDDSETDAETQVGGRVAM